MRAGAAVVATDVGGTALTARGGATLVEPTPDAIADAVAALMADDSLRAAARERARAAAADLPTAGDLLDQLIGQVLGEG